MNIRLLHVYPLPPIRSGITGYARIFQKALKTNNRIEIDTFAALKRENIKCSGFKAFWEILIKIKRLTNKNIFRKYDMIWVETGRHNAFELIVGFFISHHLPGSRLIITVHDPPSLTRSIVKYFRLPSIVRTSRFRLRVDLLLEKIIVRKAFLVFVLSKRGADAFVDRFERYREKVYTLPHVAYESTDVTMRRKSEIVNKVVKNDQIYFKTFGFFSENKGSEILFLAFDKFLNQNSMSHNRPILIIGGGGIDKNTEYNYLNKLKQLALKLGIDKDIVFTGYIPDDELNAFLDSSDIFIFPYTKTYNYSSSGVLMRVLTAGAPAIVSDVNTLSELIKNGINGFLIKPGDSDALAEAMLHLYSDPDLRASMRINSIDYVMKNHSWEVVEQCVREHLFN